MDMHNLSPKMEMFDYEKIVVRYSTNMGVQERDHSKFFTQLWMPFAWAAILGFAEDKSLPLKYEDLKRDTFKYSTINNQSERVFQSLVLFAVAKKGYEILSNSADVNKVIEEHARGGFEILHTKLSEDPEYFNNEWNYISFLLDRLPADEEVV